MGGAWGGWQAYKTSPECCTWFRFRQHATLVKVGKRLFVVCLIVFLNKHTVSEVFFSLLR